MSEREVVRYRGPLVQMVGDGSLSTFDGPARAIRSAQGILDASAPLGLRGRSLDAVIIWHLLADPETRFNDLGADYFTRHVNIERPKKCQHVRHLEALG